MGCGFNSAGFLVSVTSFQDNPSSLNGSSKVQVAWLAFCGSGNVSIAHGMSLSSNEP